MPFVTEQVYGEMPKEDDAAPMLIVAAWPDAGELAAYVDEDAERAIAMVCEVVGAVRSTRARYGISPKTALPVADVYKRQGRSTRSPPRRASRLRRTGPPGWRRRTAR